MRIVHRIVTPILSLLIFPAVIFLPLFRMVISSGFSTETKTNVLSNFGLSEFISLFDIMNLRNNESNNLVKSIFDIVANSKLKENITSLSSLPWGIVFLVFFAIVLIIALALLIVSAATKKPSVSVFLSIGGIISALIMNASFNAFAAPFLSGEFSLNSILGNTNQLLSVIFGGLASVEYMKLGIAYTAILLIFIVTLILSISALVEQKNED